MSAGRHSSEFWLAIAAIVLDALGAIFNLIPHDQAGVLATASVFAYNLSRGLAKMRQQGGESTVTVTPARGSAVVVTKPASPPAP